MPIHFPGKVSDFLKIGVAAAARGDIEAVREILKARPKWLHRIGSHGRTMLWEASHRGKLDMVKYLVRRKADIDACGTHYTPYFVEVSCYCIARYKKHHDVADFLLQKGAEQNIHTAAFLSDIDGIKSYLKKRRTLLNAGHPQSRMGDSKKGEPDVVVEDAPWATPLCYALRGGSVETVKYLISRGAKIKGYERWYFIAAQTNVDKIRLLLENGADPSMTLDVYPDQEELYELVASYGGNVGSNQDASEELVYLCRGDRGGDLTELKRLIELGGDVNHQDAKGKTAMHRAAKAGFLEVMKVLFEHGAKVDVPDNNGETALFDVMLSTIKDRNAQKKAIRMLLKAGADANHENRKGQSPKTLAKSSKHPRERKLGTLLK